MITNSNQKSIVRSSVIQLPLKDILQVYELFTHMFKNGGLFIPISRTQIIGESIFVLVTLPDGNRMYALSGKVVWITPEKSPNSRLQGVGISLNKDESSDCFHAEVDRLLNNYIAPESKMIQMI